MAEAFAKTYGRERGWAIEAMSAGVNAFADNRAAPRSIKAMTEVGIDIGSHRSRPIDEENTLWADYVLVMELRHATRIRELWPQQEGKVMMLGNFGGVMEIEDPYGSWFMGRYRRSRDEIQRCTHTFIDRLPVRRADGPVADTHSQEPA
jgi:protein-tyrosine phosphatase